MEGGGLSGGGRIGGDHNLAHDSLLDARVELGDLQVLGVDAVDRRQRPTEDVVAAPELVRALDRDHIRGLLDDTDQLGVAALVGADPAARSVGEVEADLAQADPLLDLADRVGEGEGVLVRDPEQMEGKPLGGPSTDAGKLGELRDQTLHGRRVHGFNVAGVPARALRPGLGRGGGAMVVRSGLWQCGMWRERHRSPSAVRSFGPRAPKLRGAC